jgi:N utilization substance protein A
VRELNNEKIDIIAWSVEPEVFIRRALAPVVPTEVIINHTDKTAKVIIPDENIAGAVGRKGQNIRLASTLTGFNLNPLKESEYYEEEIELASVELLNPDIRAKLIEAGYNYVDEILDAGALRLTEIPGINEPLANNIIELLESLYEEENDDNNAKIQPTEIPEE